MASSQLQGGMLVKFFYELQGQVRPWLRSRWNRNHFLLLCKLADSKVQWYCSPQVLPCWSLKLVLHVTLKKCASNRLIFKTGVCSANQLDPIVHFWLHCTLCACVGLLHQQQTFQLSWFDHVSETFPLFYIQLSRRANLVLVPTLALA